MSKMKNAIDGLEWILSDDRFGFGEHWEKGKPRDDYEKAGEIITDVIALLKEQEPRILGWDEIKNYSVVYGEFKGVSEIFPLIITFDSKGRALSWNPCINKKEEYLLLVYDEEDRKNTRCWNKMPTEEQRRSVMWE